MVKYMSNSGLKSFYCGICGRLISFYAPVTRRERNLEQDDHNSIFVFSLRSSQRSFVPASSTGSTAHIRTVLKSTIIVTALSASEESFEWELRASKRATIEFIQSIRCYELLKYSQSLRCAESTLALPWSQDFHRTQ